MRKDKQKGEAGRWEKISVRVKQNMWLRKTEKKRRSKNK